MANVLSSKSFTRDRAIKDRLTRCANSDPDHIFQGKDNQGGHVSKIHEALVAIMPDDHGIKDFELQNEVYGESTAKAVLRFKGTPTLNGTGKQILGSGQPAPDDIVGKQTIMALDRLMVKLQGGPPVPPPPPPEKKIPQDIFVYFRGAPPAQQGTTDTLVERGFTQVFNTPEYLKTHKPVIAICFFGGRGATDKSNDVIRQVDLLRSSNSEGKTIIRGDSIGGLTALKTASALSQRGIKLNYVAIDDAAFFPPDEIRTFDPLAFEAPTNITADLKQNFLQTFGHELLRDSDSPDGFLEGTEFHGNLPGFINIPTEPKPNTAAIIVAFNSLPEFLRKSARIRFRFASQAHEAAHKDADPLIDSVVSGLMKADVKSNATP